MSFNPQTSAAGKNAMLAALTALLNVGGAGSIQWYTGSQPATPDTAISGQTLLATDTFSATSFAAPSAGVATANSITSGTAVASGTLAWGRCLSGAGTAVIDVAAGTSASDAIVATTAITTGNTVPITSFTLTHA
jgi:hypothetical protein